MQSFSSRIKLIAKNAVKCPRSFDSLSSRVCKSEANDPILLSRLVSGHILTKSYGSLIELPAPSNISSTPFVMSAYRGSKPGFSSGAQFLTRLTNRGITTLDDSQNADPQNASTTATEVAPRIKFKRLDKTARHIMQILDKEAVEEVQAQREIPDIRPGYTIQLKLEVPENKRRVSTVKGTVIARRNAGLNTTIRLRRVVAGVGIESLLPLYSPNVKEIQILEKKRMRRAKLYYIRGRKNALKK